MSLTKKVTAKDVAERSGVSRSLISMYLTGNSKVWLSEETKARIDEAIKTLNYTPNRLAQSLRKGKTKTLGVVMGGISNRFSGCFGEALMDEVENHGYRLFVALTKFDMERERLALTNLLDYQIDAVIYTLSTSFSQDFFQQFERSSCPIVLTEDIPNMNFNCVCYDYLQSMIDALVHLMKLGYRKTAFLIPPCNQGIGDAARQAAQTASVLTDVIPWKADEAGNADAAQRLREQHCDSVISLVENPAPLFDGGYAPGYITSYALPVNELGSSLGAICYPFRQWVEAIVANTIRAAENSASPCSKLRIPCEFMEGCRAQEYRAAQISEPYYESFR